MTTTVSLIASLRAAGGAILRWQLPDGEVRAALATGEVLYDDDTDLIYLPGYDIVAERANVRPDPGTTTTCFDCHQDFADGQMVERLVLTGGELCRACAESREKTLKWWLDLEEAEWEALPQSVREKLWITYDQAHTADVAHDAVERASVKPASNEIDP